MPKGERRNLPHTAMCGILFLLHAAIPRYGEARDAFEEVFDKLKAMDAARGAAEELFRTMGPLLICILQAPTPRTWSRRDWRTLSCGSVARSSG